MAYDVLGRITQKAREGEAMPGYEIPPPNPVPRGESQVNNFLYTYDYDPDNELIKRIASPGGAQIFSYDNLNRLLTKTDSIGGSLYTAAYSYDSQGKIDTVIYNSSVVVANSYNNFGYLDEI